jgi:hypothetical protein
LDVDARELVEEGVQGLDSRGQREEAGVFKHLGEAVEERPRGAGLELLISLLEAIDLEVGVVGASRCFLVTYGEF